MGRLGRPHGLNGFLGLYFDDADLSLVQPGARVFVGEIPLTVREIRRTDRGHQVAFEEVPDRTAAEAIRGLAVFTASVRQLEDGEYWSRDLIGLTVITLTGEKVGTVADVVMGAAQDRLVIEGANGAFEVPFVDELVPEVDLESGLVRINALPGLINDSLS